MPPVRSRTSRQTLAVAGAAGAAAYGAWWWLVASQPPELTIDSESETGKAVMSCPALTSKYTPPPFLTGAHAQTLFNRFRSLTVDAGYARQLLPCAYSSHGNGPTTVVLDWVRGSDCPLAAAPSAPVLLILHGAAGSSADCKHAAVGAADRGWRAAVLTLRRRRGGGGGGGGWNSSTDPSSGLPSPSALSAPAAREAAAAAAASAVRTALYSINDRFPRAPLLGLGYAAGGAVLVRALAEAAAKGGGGGGGRGSSSSRSHRSSGRSPRGGFGSASAASLGSLPSSFSSSGVPRFAAAVAISSPLGDGAAARAAVAAAGGRGLVGLDSLYARRVGAALRRAASATAAAAASVGASHGRRERERDGRPYDAPAATATASAASAASLSSTSTLSSSSPPSSRGGSRRSPSPENAEENSFSSSSGKDDSDRWLSHDAVTLDAVRRIDAPTLLLAAADDPLVRGAWPPLVDAVKGNRTGSAALAVTARGGHLGFLTGASGLGLSWAEEAALQFLGVWADEDEDGDDDDEERDADDENEREHARNGNAGAESFDADGVAAANTAAAFEAATAVASSRKQQQQQQKGGASASSSASHLSSTSSAGGAAGGGGGGGVSDESARPESPRGVIASVSSQKQQQPKKPAIKKQQQQQPLNRIPRRVPTVSMSLASLGSTPTLRAATTTAATTLAAAAEEAKNGTVQRPASSA